MKTIRSTIFAGFASLAMIATASIAVPSQAHANGKLAGALIGGLFVGSIVGAATQPAYAAPGYGVVYTPQCWDEPTTAYDAYGNPYTSYVRVCR